MNLQKTSSALDKLDNWDIAGCLYLNSFCRTKTVNNFFARVSRLGDGVFWYSLALVLPLLYGEKGLILSAIMMSAGGVCLLIYKQLKTRLIRERPFIRSKEVFKGCAPLDKYSFPSGHTMHAACFSTVVLWHLPEFAILLVPFSILIALSRMVLGLHYPTDVLCGAGLGIMLASMANYLSPISL